MKKLYTFLLSSLSFLAFSQGSINFDDAAKWTQGGAAFTSYSNHSYLDGVFSLACNNVIRNTTAAQDAFPGGFGTYSLRLKNDVVSDATMTIASGGVGSFTFKARRWDNAPAVDYNVEYSTDGGTTWILSSVINAAVTPDSDWKTIAGVINSTNANIKIRIKANSAGERLFVDDFAWTAVSTSPSIIVNDPSNGAVFSPVTTSTNVTFTIYNFNVANGSGDGHIHYTINGGSTVMKYDTNPITLTGLAPGTYVVYIQLVDNTHTPIVPAVNATVSFTVSSYTVVNNLGALRADVIANGVGKYYQINSNPVITYARSATYRNQKYVQDTSAGILIDDLAATISTPMVAGDAIAGLKGKTSLFSGLLQFTPIENATVATSGNTITPEIVTAAAISANVEMYESELVQINAASFTAADGTAAFVVNTNNTLNDGSDIVFRTSFPEANYIGSVIPTGSANRVVLVSKFNTAAQVVARSLADVTLSSPSFNAIEGLKMYPNPLKGNVLNITSTANATMNVQIFDLLGKEVLKADVMNSTVNVAALNAGVYMVKITEEGKTATRKLVKQ